MPETKREPVNEMISLRIQNISIQIEKKNTNKVQKLDVLCLSHSFGLGVGKIKRSS